MKYPWKVAMVAFFLVVLVSWYIWNTHPVNAPEINQNDLPDTSDSVSEGGLKLQPIDQTQPSPTSVTTATIEKNITLNQQAIRIYEPSVFDQDTTLRVIIYSHGSNENVDSARITDTFDKNLTNYGNYFSLNNSVFIASELYGANWGSSEARKHIEQLIAYANNTYPVNHTIHLFGFSMGGLAALRSARDFPEKIDSVLLLAPTVALDDWSRSAVEKLESIPITIWHGTKDVNVPITTSEALVARLQQYGHPSVTFNKVTNEVHRHFVSPEALLNALQP